MALVASKLCGRRNCLKQPLEDCSSLLCPRPKTEKALAELRAWLQRKAPLEDGCKTGAGGSMVPPPPTDAGGES